MSVVSYDSIIFTQGALPRSILRGHMAGTVDNVSSCRLLAVALCSGGTQQELFWRLVLSGTMALCQSSG
jgi:hypothetical protein